MDRRRGDHLARGHARTGDAAEIAGYLGKNTKFDEAIEEFSVAYADQADRDYEVLVKAIRAGRLPASSDALPSAARAPRRPPAMRSRRAFW